MLCLALTAALLSQPAPAAPAPPTTTPTAPAPASTSTTPASTTTTASTTTPAVGRLRVLVMDLEAEAVAPEVARGIGGLVAVKVSEDARLDVLAGDDLRRLADFEANKQSLGCATDSCLAELAGAMDAELVLYGRVTGLGDSVLLTLNVFDVKAARSAGRTSLQAENASAVPPLLPPRLRDLMDATLTARFGDGLRVVDDGGAGGGGKGGAGVVVAGVGGGLVVLGVVAAVVGVQPGQIVSDAEVRFRDGDASAVDDAKAWYPWQGVGNAVAVGGAGAVVVGVVTGLVGLGMMVVE